LGIESTVTDSRPPLEMQRRAAESHEDF